MFSLGTAASVGMTFLQEGACDLIYAIKNGIFDRNISWGAYGIRKACNLTVTMITFGFGALKAAAQGAKEGLKAAGRVVTGVARNVTTAGLKLATELVARTAAVEVGKVALNHTIDYVCAGTVENSVGNVIKSGVNKALIQVLGNNRNLELLLQCDRKEKGKRFGSMFAKRAMGKLHQNHPLIEQSKQGAMDILNKSMDKAGYGAEMKICSIFIKGFGAITSVSAIVASFEYMKVILEQLEAENHNDTERILKKQEAKQCEDQAYSKEFDYSPRKFLENLSEDISAVLSDMVMGLTKQYIVSKTVPGISQHLISELDKEIDKFRSVRKETANYIENVAEIIPGDIVQAKYSAKFIQKPIKITTTDEIGSEKIEIFGAEFSTEEPVELIFERPVDGGIGHYKLSDGSIITPSGETNCLYDAIGKKTGHNADDLRRGTSHVMKNNLDDVTEDAQGKSFTDLCVGGAKMIRPGEVRLKHFKKLNRGTDIQAVNDRGNKERIKVNQAPTTKKPKKQPIPTEIHIFDTESEELDNRLENTTDATLEQDPNAKKFSHMERNIWAAKVKQDPKTGVINQAEIFHVSEVEIRGYLDQNTGNVIWNHVEVPSIVEETIDPAFPRQKAVANSKNRLPPNPWRHGDNN